MTDDRLARLAARRANRDKHPARTARVLATGVSVSALASLVSAFTVQAAAGHAPGSASVPVAPDASRADATGTSVTAPTSPAPATPAPIRHVVSVDVIQPQTPATTAPTTVAPTPQTVTPVRSPISLGGGGGGLGGGTSSGSSGGSH